MIEPRIKVMEAIARQRILTASYNGAIVRLRPHLLFERHEELFLSALNVDKGWREGEEMRLGQFKLSGLGNITVLEESFEPLADFNGQPPRADDVLIMTI